MRSIYSDATTLYQSIRRGARISKDGPMLGYRCKKQPGEPYVWMSYKEVISRAGKIARAMRALNVPVGQEAFIGIFAKNRPEWILVEQATYCFRNVIGMQFFFIGEQQFNRKILFSTTLRDFGCRRVRVHHQPDFDRIGGELN
jgi:long-chain acyl-CoA synthetase